MTITNSYSSDPRTITLQKAKLLNLKTGNTPFRWNKYYTSGWVLDHQTYSLSELVVEWYDGQIIEATQQ